MPTLAPPAPPHHAAFKVLPPWALTNESFVPEAPVPAWPWQPPRPTPPPPSGPLLGVGEAINRLPRTAGEVAALFRREGIRGIRGHSDRCPVQVWLAKVTGQQRLAVGYVGHGGGAVRHYPPGAPAPVHYLLGAGASAFMRHFDAGAWPDLAENECDCCKPDGTCAVIALAESALGPAGTGLAAGTAWKLVHA
jgi:hypothetical protein